MSHVVLRRVAIRLLHDAAFAEALRTDPDRALAGIDLSPDERRLLVVVPPAAWRTDPDRERRLLAALADEFHASLALAPGRAAAFVSSRHFHRAVQERGSLALAFGAHMADDGDPRVVELARLESAVAAVRREPPRVAPSPPGTLRLTPHARALSLRAGTTALMDALRSGREASPIGEPLERVLVVRDRGTGEVTLEELPEGLAGVLDMAAEPAPRGALLAGLGGLGAHPDEAEQVLAALEADALLV